jgi:drug/metabolite transporter (DMT)-like permease
VSAQLWGDLLGLAASATWAWYTVSVSPLLHRYSTLRVSTVAFAMGTVPLLIVGSHQLATQDYDLGATIWLLYAFAVIGPLVVANMLWFGGISRVGPSRAAVFANLQPFLAAIFSVLILSEPLSRWQVVGGLAIAAGILLSRPPRRGPAPSPAVGTVQE